ncbi:molecular chaperone OsmY [Acerihabitans sp. TG2]|uniref:molecular chaperone OsmY n=1 Tax=Acerihabitans sp. TG2 TaxID=3096008 RepID=UPI002B233E13|nr:molecular chaperone OsmY [Acerihabitans sp. TG2]MEA9392910.1 molecular chaperone OsmY [Acerihabitans sp. TG2]
MNKIQMTKTLTAMVLSTLLAGTTAMANDTIKQEPNSTGAKVDNTMKTAANYMDDSAVTAKVKSALIGDKSIDGNDISVVTTKGVVTLSGFVSTQDQAKRAVAASKTVDGVKSVSDKLRVKGAEGTSVKGYASDAAITTAVKAKLLTDMMTVNVETDAGVVQLSGSVKNANQAARAESVTKTVDGVKSVKNDLTY